MAHHSSVVLDVETGETVAAATQRAHSRFRFRYLLGLADFAFNDDGERSANVNTSQLCMATFFSKTFQLSGDESVRARLLLQSRVLNALCLIVFTTFYSRVVVLS